MHNEIFDLKDDPPDGSKTHKINLPANVPAKGF
jgi:hypothetical protein